MAKKRSVKSKKSKISKKDPKNLLYVIGTAVIILVLFAVVFMYSGSPLVGQAFLVDLDDGNQILYDLDDVTLAGDDAMGVLPAKLIFKNPNNENEITMRVKNDDGGLSYYTVTFTDIIFADGKYQIQGLDFSKVDGGPVDLCEGVNCPDLSISDLTITPDEALGTIALEFTVFNLGDVDVTSLEVVSVLENANHEAISKDSMVNDLAVGSSQEVEVIFDPESDIGQSGLYYTFSQFYDFATGVGLSAHVMLDPEHQVQESNEQNNFMLRCIADLSCLIGGTEFEGLCNPNGDLCIGQAGPVCDNDGVCDAGETEINCPADCQAAAPFCGDGICNGDDTIATCPADCLDPGICPNVNEPCMGATFEDGVCTAIGICTLTCPTAAAGDLCTFNGGTVGSCDGTGACVVNAGVCPVADSSDCTDATSGEDGLCIEEGVCRVTCEGAVFGTACTFNNGLTEGNCDDADVCVVEPVACTVEEYCTMTDANDGICILEGDGTTTGCVYYCDSGNGINCPAAMNCDEATDISTLFVGLQGKCTS